MNTIGKWAVRILVAAVVAAAVGWLGLYAASEALRNQRFTFAAKPLPAGPADVAAGAKLARLFGCGGCHTPSLRGQVLVDDPGFGRIVAPNVTLAAKGYTDVQLAQIIRAGVRPDGRGLYVMPSESFSRMSDPEIASLIAYVRTVPAGGAPLGETFQPGPFARFLLLTGGLEAAPAMVAQARTRPLPDYGPATAAGRGIARACVECHGADLGGMKTRGPDLRIAAAYDLPAFARLLRTGNALDGKPVKPIGALGDDKDRGLMADIAPDHFGGLTDAEIADLHAYLMARVSHLAN